MDPFEFETTTDRFDRLQNLLLAMRKGDELHSEEAARLTGLSEHLCLAMLEGLERAGLMARKEGHLFVRQTGEGSKWMMGDGRG